MAMLARPAVALLCALELAHADSDHFREPALDPSGEVCMGLDAVNHQDSIRLPRLLVHERLEALCGQAERNRLHARADFSADALGRYAKLLQHVTLTFSRATSM